MDSETINEIKIPKIDLNKIKFPIIAGILFILVYFCFYQVEANEEAVILRLGKYSSIEEETFKEKIVSKAKNWAFRVSFVINKRDSLS